MAATEKNMSSLKTHTYRSKPQNYIFPNHISGFYLTKHTNFNNSTSFTVIQDALPLYTTTKTISKLMCQ